MSNRGSVSIDDLPPEAQAKVRDQVNGVTLGANSPLRASRRKPRELELVEQRKVIQWADDFAQRAKWPELERLFHVPNGGHRSKAVAGKMKSAGVRRGVPDLWLPARRQALNGAILSGCVIELKADKNGQLSGVQRDWLHFLNDEGWVVWDSYGAEHAIQNLTTYLSLPRVPR